MHTFIYHEILLHALLLLDSKIVESLQCILKVTKNPSENKTQRTFSWAIVLYVDRDIIKGNIPHVTAPSDSFKPNAYR